jgi:hypothetical protein
VGGKKIQLFRLRANRAQLSAQCYARTSTQPSSPQTLLPPPPPCTPQCRSSRIHRHRHNHKPRSATQEPLPGLVGHRGKVTYTSRPALTHHLSGYPHVTFISIHNTADPANTTHQLCDHRRRCRRCHLVPRSSCTRSRRSVPPWSLYPTRSHVPQSSGANPIQLPGILLNRTRRQRCSMVTTSMKRGALSWSFFHTMSHSLAAGRAEHAD